VPLYYQGHFADAAALTREAATLSEQLGKVPNAIFARSNLASIELAMDALEPARREAEAAIRLARTGGSDSALSGGLATLGEILLKSGRLDEARDAAQEGLEIASGVGNTLQATHAQCVLAGLDLREGRRESALGHLRGMQAALARHRIEVRIPMLIVAAADCALASTDAMDRQRARRWLRTVAGLEGIDAMLRRDARTLLAREGGNGDTPGAPAAGALAEVEADAGAYLAGTGPAGAPATPAAGAAAG
jgi:ATP/maltotriose-dependent transcriptional regulator MalT